MTRSRVSGGIGVAALATALLALPVLSPVPVAGQSRSPAVNADYLFRTGNIAVTFSAGAAAFTDFQREPARILPGGAVELNDFTRRVSAQTTATGSAAVSFWLSPGAALQLSGSFTPSRFKVTNQGAATGTNELTDTTRYARLDIWAADATFLLRPPMSFGRVYPYAILGGGVMRYQLRDPLANVPPEAASAFASNGRTQWAGVVGAGAVIPLQRNHLLLSFNLTDHLTQTPLDDPLSSTFDADGTTILLRPGGDSDGSSGIVLTSNLRLTVGVTIPLRLR